MGANRPLLNTDLPGCLCEKGPVDRGKYSLGPRVDMQCPHHGWESLKATGETVESAVYLETGTYVGLFGEPIQVTVRFALIPTLVGQPVYRGAGYNLKTGQRGDIYLISPYVDAPILASPWL